MREGEARMTRKPAAVHGEEEAGVPPDLGSHDCRLLQWKRWWLCNYEQGQRSFQWPLMRGDRMWVKEPNYHPERWMNERCTLVTRLKSLPEWRRSVFIVILTKNCYTSLPHFVAWMAVTLFALSLRLSPFKCQVRVKRRSRRKKKRGGKKTDLSVADSDQKM